MPALGTPIKPASTTKLSSIKNFPSSPGRPCVDCSGERLVDDLKCSLPRPPCPPFKIRSVCPSSVNSKVLSLSKSVTREPTGTSIYRSSEALPCWLKERPDWPSSALKTLEPVYFESRDRSLTARTKTSPPRPPLPPAGPLIGLNFSLRQRTTPLPPLPALASIRISSTNISGYLYHELPSPSNVLVINYCQLLPKSSLIYTLSNPYSTNIVHRS